MEAKQQGDFYHLTMPSGRQMTLKVETPLTARDRAWLHALVDLILGSDTPSPTNTDSKED